MGEYEDFFPTDDFDDEGGEVVEFARPGGIQPKPAPDFSEIGVSSALPTGSWNTYLQGWTEAENRSKLSIPELVEMRRKDGQIRALIRLVTLPIRKAAQEGEWIEPDEGGAEKETEFANQMWTLPPYMGGMTQPWTKVVRQMSLALYEGFSAFEIVPYVPEVGPLKGKIVLRKLSHRDAKTITFRVDDTGGFDGFRQRTTVQGKEVDVIIPKEKAWYYAANEEENPFYGVSWFETAYFHHDIKKRLYYISHLAAQFAAVPARVGKYPRNADPNRLVLFKRALDSFAFNTSMTAPDGFDVDLMNMNTSFDFLKLIDHHNAQMSKSVLAKFMDDEQRQVLIENGTADPSTDMFLMAIEAVIAEIEESITHYIMPRFIDWNFGTQKYPVFKFAPLSDQHREVMIDMLKVVATAQASMWTKEFVRELEMKTADRFGLDVDYDEVAKREAEEAEEAEAMKQREAQLFDRQFGGGGGPGGPPQPGGGPPGRGGPPQEGPGF